MAKETSELTGAQWAKIAPLLPIPQVSICSVTSLREGRENNDKTCSVCPDNGCSHGMRVRKSHKDEYPL